MGLCYIRGNIGQSAQEGAGLQGDSELVLKVPWTVRARLEVPAPRRFRKAPKIFLGRRQPSNKEKSRSSISHPAHPLCRSVATPGGCCGFTGRLFPLLQPSPGCPSSAAPMASVQRLTPAPHLQGAFLQHGLYLSVFL